MQWYRRLTSDSGEAVSQHSRASRESAPQDGRARGQSVPQDAPADARMVAEPAPARKDTAGVRIYVKVDMEGVSGIVSPEQVKPGAAEYRDGRRMLMRDLTAVLEGAFSAGCTEALVYDAHSAGRNVDMESLDPRVSVISGRPLPRDGFYCGLDDSFRALFLVGYHARAGSQDAVLPRTYEDDIASLKVNGTEIGEIGMEAALAGKFGVPLVFVSADSGGVREARELLGDDVQAVEVKKAVTATSGVCLPVTRTEDLLRDAAARALRHAASVPPVVFQSPTTLEVIFRSAESADAVARMPEIERTGPDTVRTQGPSILVAYRNFVLARQGNGSP